MNIFWLSINEYEIDDSEDSGIDDCDVALPILFRLYYYLPELY